MWNVKNQSRHYTTSLLNAVALRLNSTTEVPFNSPTITFAGNDSTMFAIFEHFSLLFAKHQELKPSNVSKVFAITHFFITHYMTCTVPTTENVDKEMATTWPCEEDYLGDVKHYKYFGWDLEMSILLERSLNLEQEFYYLCISFPRKPELYYVEQIPTNEIPSFTKKSEDTDEEFIICLQNIVTEAFTTFCRNVVCKKRLKTKEYSLEAIHPIFSQDLAPIPLSSRKRKKPDESSSSESGVLKPTQPQFYIKLKDHFEKMNPKPDALSRLFALIHNMLVSLRCRTNLPSNEWPITPIYKSQIIPLFFAGSKKNVNPVGNIQANINMSLLCNSNEFYLVLRSTLEPSRLCVRKIIKKLVPSFNSTDVLQETEIIENLCLWSTNIVKKFVYNVIEGLSESTSFVSVPCSSRSSQADEDQNEEIP